MPGNILLAKRRKRIQLLGVDCCWVGFFPDIGKVSKTELDLVFILDEMHVSCTCMCFLSLSSLFKSLLNSAQ